MTNILYKYRSLDNFKYFVDIILKNRLYASKYKDMNDPMEGQYYYNDGELDQRIRNMIIEEKDKLRLCSLSRVNNNELMWSHYANGQRGVAIGVRIAENEYAIRPILYEGLATIKNRHFHDLSAVMILSQKLVVWNYEEEERVFVRDKHFIDVQIEEIITGRGMSNSDFGFIKELVEKINPSIKIIKAETIIKIQSCTD